MAGPWSARSAARAVSYTPSVLDAAVLCTSVAVLALFSLRASSSSGSARPGGAARPGGGLIRLSRYTPQPCGGVSFGTKLSREMPRPSWYEPEHSLRALCIISSMAPDGEEQTVEAMIGNGQLTSEAGNL